MTRVHPLAAAQALFGECPPPPEPMLRPEAMARARELHAKGRSLDQIAAELRLTRPAIRELLEGKA